MSRHYKIDGFELPSVTTIISDCCDKSQGLMGWSAKMVCEWIKQNCDLVSNKYGDIEFYEVTEEDLDNAQKNYREASQTALDVGSKVHACIESYLKTCKEPKIENPQVLAAFVAFLEWKDEVNLEPIYLEQTVRGKYWAGTLDFFGWIKLPEWKEHKLYVIDWKSSKAIYASEMGPQIAAYRSACKKQSGWLHTYGEGTEPRYENNVEGSAILRLDKETGLPEFKDFSKRYESDLNIFNRMVDLFFARHPILARKAGYKED